MASIISQQRVVRYLQSRFNPIRQLTPEWLAQTIDSFQAGFLREFALLSDTIEQRDDVLMAVVPKRKKAIGRNGYEVLTLPGVPAELEAQAKKHQEALKHFYDHVTATNAINENETGGFKLLVRQMADAIGKKIRGARDRLETGCRWSHRRVPVRAALVLRESHRPAALPADRRRH
jgi:hypothetical protein